jgi:hypothetical protein
MRAPDPWQHYPDAWRARCGLRRLDHPSFEGLSRVWRVELHPTFHDDVAITVTDIDVGGWIELRVLPAAARTWAMHDIGLRAVLQGEPPTPRVWEAAVTAEALDAVAAAMPRLPLHSVPVEGRDGITVHFEAVLEGTAHAFDAWCPSPRRAPLHYAFLAALCGLAARTFPDPAAQAAVQPLADYLR